MAERKLRSDAAASAAIPNPHLRMPEPGGSDNLVESGPAVLAALPNLDTPQDAHRDRSSASARESSADSQPSKLESAIRQKLITQPSARFWSLVVREIDGGICLEGTLETAVDMPDVERLVRSVAHVDRVLNRLVTMPPDAPSV